MVLHVHSPDSDTITEALQFFLQQKQVDLRKLTDKDMMVLLCLLGRKMEFVNEIRPPLLMQSTSSVLVTC